MRQRTDWGDLLDEPPRTPPTSNNTTAKATGSQRQ
jgi:hypothetical protein